jgi:hypothetical protein
MKYILIMLISISTVYGSDFAFESPYIESRPAINDLDDKLGLPTKTDVHSLIALQTSVKSQKSRGTCTMFTTMGMIEHLFIKERNASKSIDLSEEWMEYIIMTKKQTEGSSTSKNFKAALKNGFTTEKMWPYLGKRWRELTDSPLASETCSHLEGPKLQSCLLGHRDPDFLTMSDELLMQRDFEFYNIKSDALSNISVLNDLIVKKKSYRLKKLSDVKRLLSEGTALIMGTKLYYGSWNHSKTDKLEIQKRDKSKWYKGIVAYPEPGSKDRRISFEQGGGHSLIIVGYDDEKVIESRMLMEDGTWKEFSYKGVYYFKNSWGVRGSGKRFVLDGVTYPGYGMITQKYAHEMGTFFHIPVK